MICQNLQFHCHRRFLGLSNFVSHVSYIYKENHQLIKTHHIVQHIHTNTKHTPYNTQYAHTYTAHTQHMHTQYTHCTYICIYIIASTPKGFLDNHQLLLQSSFIDIIRTT